MRRSLIMGCGGYLPRNLVTNDDLAKYVDTSDEWISQRTGIKSRHIAGEGENTSDMAFFAAQKALKNANIAATDIDAIILATTSPDRTFPATAVTVQDKLGMKDHGFAFDIQAVCSGFVYALSIADNFIKSGQINRALVIGAEHFTSLLDWEDRTTCVLFGDGAGAVVLESSENNVTGTVQDRGIISTHLHSEGAFRDILYVDGGPSKTKTTGHVRMIGKDVFKHAVKRMTEVVEEALYKNNVTAADIKWVIPHQANNRIIESVIKKVGLSKEQVVVTIAAHGNTSAASIPLALNVASEDGRLQKNDLILIEALGGGLTWGASLIRW